MTVHTQLDSAEVSHFIAHYQVGKLLGFRPIHGGVTNSNYFVSTDQDEFVLTLFETLSASELEFYLTVLMNLESYLPVACPLADSNGLRIHRIRQKPVVLAVKLIGEHIDQPTKAQCKKIGEALAVLHITCAKLPVYENNPRGFSWQQHTLNKILPLLSVAEKQTAERAFKTMLTIEYGDLPQTIIHGDLFRDNVLFSGDSLTGLLDFYFACSDAMVYDIAITAVDWCFDAENNWLEGHFQALLSGYEYIRKLQPAEKKHFNALFVQACSRFWLSRFWATIFVKDEAVLKKPPQEMYQRLQIALSRIET